MLRDAPSWVNYDDMPSSILSSPFFTPPHQHSTSVTSPQQSWAQQLDGFAEKDDGYRISTDNQYKKMSTWYDPNFSSTSKPNADAELDNREVFYGSNGAGRPYHGFPLKSCHGEDMLDFSNNKSVDFGSKRQPSEDGGIGVGKCKRGKAISPPQPPLKVRKEKLGDRITALHQLVSPFGKTDTASVLLEAIGYIRFLQGQVEALSSPYVRKTRSQQYSVEKEGEEGEGGELRGRGLCLVPIPCAGENGEDYWFTSIGAGEGGCF